MELICVSTLHPCQTPQSCLHTDSYRHILAGQGFGVDAARAAVETVYQIRNAAPPGLHGDYHPFCNQTR